MDKVQIGLIDSTVDLQVGEELECRGEVEMVLLHAGECVEEECALWIDFGFGAKGDKPIKGVDYWTEEERADMAREIREALSYNQSYDMTDAQLPDNISGEGLSYDEVQKMYRAFGEVRIKVPRRLDYYLGLSIGERFDEGEITICGESHGIGNNMTFFIEDVDEIVFSVDIYIWLKSITVQAFKPEKIPTKVSELENDLQFVASEIVEENLILNIR